MIFPRYDDNGKIKHNGWRHTAIKELKARLEELGIYGRITKRDRETAA